MMAIAPLAILGMAVFVFLGGEIVKLLWNALLPPLFGWPQLSFWQALGLLVLCRILFGGWSGGRRYGGPRSRIRERIDQRMRERMEERMAGMTPEERAAYRRRMRALWGLESEPAPDAGERPQDG